MNDRTRQAPYSLSVVQTFSQFISLESQSSLVSRLLGGYALDYTRLEGPAYDGFKCVTFYTYDYEDLKDKITIHYDSGERPVSSLYLPFDAPDPLILSGEIGGFAVSVRKSGRTVFNGSLSSVLTGERGNWLMLPPHLFDEAITLFEDRYGIPLRGMYLLEIDCGFNFLTQLSVEDTMKHFGSYRGALPYRYRVGSQTSAMGDQSGDLGAMYYGHEQRDSPSEADEWRSTIDTIRLYDKRRQLMAEGRLSDADFGADGLLEDIAEYRWMRYERRFRTQLKHPVTRRSLLVRDLIDESVHQAIATRVVQTIIDTNKNMVVPKRIEDIRGHRSKIVEERGEALRVLHSIDSEVDRMCARNRNRRGGAHIRSAEMVRARRLARRHGDVFSPDSFWGQLLRYLFQYTSQYSYERWVRFHCQWYSSSVSASDHFDLPANDGSE